MREGQRLTVRSLACSSIKGGLRKNGSNPLGLAKKGKLPKLFVDSTDHNVKETNDD
jgi:hypothetical protein